MTQAQSLKWHASIRELCPGYHLGPSEQCRLLLVSTQNVLVRAILVLPAYRGLLTIMHYVNLHSLTDC